MTYEELLNISETENLIVKEKIFRDTVDEYTRTESQYTKESTRPLKKHAFLLKNSDITILLSEIF